MEENKSEEFPMINWGGYLEVLLYSLEENEKTWKDICSYDAIFMTLKDLENCNTLDDMKIQLNNIDINIQNKLNSSALDSMLSKKGKFPDNIFMNNNEEICNFILEKFYKEEKNKYKEFLTTIIKNKSNLPNIVKKLLSFMDFHTYVKMPDYISYNANIEVIKVFVEMMRKHECTICKNSLQDFFISNTIYNNIEILKFLIELKLDLNEPLHEYSRYLSSWSKCLLESAFNSIAFGDFYCKIETVKFLLENGLVFDHNYVLYEIASRNKKTELLEYIFQNYTFSKNVINELFQCCSIDNVKIIVKYGGTISFRNLNLLGFLFTKHTNKDLLREYIKYIPLETLNINEGFYFSECLENERDDILECLLEIDGIISNPVYNKEISLKLKAMKKSSYNLEKIERLLSCIDNKGKIKKQLFLKYLKYYREKAAISNDKYQSILF